MEWTDGMEYQLTKIAKTHHRGRGEVVSAVSTIASTITVRADPSESRPRFDSDEPGANSDRIHQHALITGYM